MFRPNTLNQIKKRTKVKPSEAHRSNPGKHTGQTPTVKYTSQGKCTGQTPGNMQAKHQEIQAQPIETPRDAIIMICLMRTPIHAIIMINVYS